MHQFIVGEFLKISEFNPIQNTTLSHHFEFVSLSREIKLLLRFGSCVRFNQQKYFCFLQILPDLFLPCTATAWMRVQCVSESSCGCRVRIIFGLAQEIV